MSGCTHIMSQMGAAARGTNSDGDHRCPTQITISVHGGGWITLFVTDEQWIAKSMPNPLWQGELIGDGLGLSVWMVESRWILSTDHPCLYGCRAMTNCRFCTGGVLGNASMYKGTLIGLLLNECQLCSGDCINPNPSPIVCVTCNHRASIPPPQIQKGT